MAVLNWKRILRKWRVRWEGFPDVIEVDNTEKSRLLRRASTWLRLPENIDFYFNLKDPISNSLMWLYRRHVATFRAPLSRGIITFSKKAQKRLQNENYPHMSSVMTMFQPPVNRSMQVLDRCFFKKTVPLSALSVFEDKNLSKVRSVLQRNGDILQTILRPIRPDETIPGRKCILMRPGIVATGRLFV